MNSKDVVSSFTIYLFNYLFIYIELGSYMAQAGVEFPMYFGISLNFGSFWFPLLSARITKSCFVWDCRSRDQCLWSRITLPRGLHLRPLSSHSKLKKLEIREVRNWPESLSWASATSLDESEVYNLNHYVFIIFRKWCGFRRSHTDISECSKSASPFRKSKWLNG